MTRFSAFAHRNVLVFCVAAAAAACEPSDQYKTTPEEGVLNLPETPLSYLVNLPAHFLTNDGGPLPTRITDDDNQPADNVITDAGATLGRVLFYDKALSKNRTVSCSSCHRAEHAFSDERILSKGFEQGETRRHSMALVFARYYDRGRFFWDERASSLEDQVLRPIQDEVEMGLTLEELIEHVEGETYYADLFTDAFGDETVSSDRISKALSQFVRSIVAVNSRYDVGRAQVATIGTDFPNFTAEENLGKQLFLRPVNNGGGGCFGCHTTEAFINVRTGPTNNGLDAASTDDLGVYETFPQPQFLGAFKVTSLRNIAEGAPYMHDGRFATLKEVVEFYNEGIQAHPNLAPALRQGGPTGPPVRMNFSDAQVSAIVAFLNTLSDPSVATAEKWSNPFIQNRN